MLPRFLPGVEIDDIINVLESNFDDDKITNELSTIFGSKKFYLVSSGRQAIYLALKSIGIKRGDEVLVPALICPAVLDAIIKTKATPVITPIEDERFGLDPSSLKNAITRKTRVVIPVDIYGARCKIKEIADITDGRAVIIEDCAQSAPKEVISIHDDYASAFVLSLNFDKVLTVGGGGVLVLNNPDIFNIPEVKQEGKSERDDILSAGLLRLLMDRTMYDRFLSMTAGKEIIENKFICDESLLILFHNFITSGEFSAKTRAFLHNTVVNYIERTSQSNIRQLLKKGLWSLIRPVFPQRPEWIGDAGEFGLLKRRLFFLSLKRSNSDITMRIRISGILHKNLSTIKGLYVQKFENDPLLRFTISFEDKSKAQLSLKRLSKEGIEVGPFNYPLPVHRIPTYRKYIKIEGDMRFTEMFFNGIINLPVHKQVSDNDLDKIVEIIKGVAFGRTSA
ncbi:MAG: DegT/DnrJ/EryC1/StrS family aminotransferase [bacterium]